MANDIGIIEAFKSNCPKVTEAWKNSKHSPTMLDDPEVLAIRFMAFLQSIGYSYRLAGKGVDQVGYNLRRIEYWYQEIHNARP